MTDEQLTQFAKALIGCEKALQGTFELTAIVQEDVVSEAEHLSTLRAGIAAAVGLGPVRVMTAAQSVALAKLREAEAKATARLDTARAALKARQSKNLKDLSTLFGGLCAVLDEIRNSERAIEAAAPSEDERYQAALRAYRPVSSRPGR